ncbi:hypothetical protein ACRAWF_01680 [Streptomyces sp. L7]
MSGADVALDCSRMQAGELHFTPAVPPSGAVDLRGAHVSVLHDGEESWPGVVRLQGSATPPSSPRTAVCAART